MPGNDRKIDPEIERLVEELGQWLKAIRLSQGKTQHELAVQLGVSDQLIGKLEQGRGGSLESFEDAARALGMKLGFVDAAYVAPTPKKVHPADIGRRGAAAGDASAILSELRRLARSYDQVAPVHLLAKARHLRDLAYLQLEGTKRPARGLADHYLAAGQASGLMAFAAFDLAAWDMAEEQSRAARAVADIIDHPGLRSWAAGTQALTAYWTGQSDRALAVIDACMDRCPPGAATARLRAIQARACAYQGDRNRVRAALRSADVAMDADRGTDDLFHGVGGPFGWGHSQHTACAGTALLFVGDADSAGRMAQTALQLQRTDPYGSAVPRRAHIDLAAAELMAMRLDAAVAALGNVWAVPVQHRRHGLTERLSRIAGILAAPAWKNHQEAVELRDRIRAFVSEALVQRALPAL